MISFILFDVGYSIWHSEQATTSLGYLITFRRLRSRKHALIRVDAKKRGWQPVLQPVVQDVYFKYNS